MKISVSEERCKKYGTVDTRQTWTDACRTYAQGRKGEELKKLSLEVWLGKKKGNS